MPLDRLLRRDRALVASALAALTLLCWIYLLRMPASMPAVAAGGTMTGVDMPGMDMAMPDPHAWSVLQWFLLFVMWAVMMAAMMLPSAAPTILLVTGVHRGRGGRGSALAALGFTVGYLAVWTLFSAGAAALQLALHEAALLSPMMASTSPYLAAAILAVAGVYQWLPAKQACLKKCRSPMGFLMAEWREGVRGAVVMGVRHGAFCLGCCWALMALLFVAGVMNLVWVAVIAAVVLVEKVLPHGVLVGRAAGVALIVWAVAIVWV